MDPETTHTTPSTKPARRNGTIDLNESLLAENWRRKASFRKATKKMLTISAHYLKVALTAGQIYERSVLTQIDRRATAQNESDQFSSGWVCRRRTGTDI